MKYLYLVWSNLKRKKVRTLLTFLSIMVAFTLFGYLGAIRQGFSQGIDVAGVDRLIVRHNPSRSRSSSSRPNGCSTCSATSALTRSWDLTTPTAPNSAAGSVGSWLAQPVSISTVRATDLQLAERAGGGRADWFFCLTNGDNRNILAAQLAKQTFGIPHVLCKINDPVRSKAYATLGIDADDLSTAAGAQAAGQHRHAAPGGRGRQAVGGVAPDGLTHVEGAAFGRGVGGLSAAAPRLPPITSNRIDSSLVLM